MTERNKGPEKVERTFSHIRTPEQREELMQRLMGDHDCASPGELLRKATVVLEKQLGSRAVKRKADDVP